MKLIFTNDSMSSRGNGGGFLRCQEFMRHVSDRGDVQISTGAGRRLGVVVADDVFGWDVVAILQPRDQFGEFAILR